VELAKAQVRITKSLLFCSFTLDETIDATNITAKYVDGVLEVSLPLIAGKETAKQDIPVS
jgi:HSP20 family protein